MPVELRGCVDDGEAELTKCMERAGRDSIGGMVEAVRSRLDVVFDGATLRCRSGPDDLRPIEIRWSGPAGAAYAELELVGEWRTREYTSTCACIVRVYASDGTLLGEVTHTLSE